MIIADLFLPCARLDAHTKKKIDSDHTPNPKANPALSLKRKRVERLNSEICGWGNVTNTRVTTRLSNIFFYFLNCPIPIAAIINDLKQNGLWDKEIRQFFKSILSVGLEMNPTFF